MCRRQFKYKCLRQETIVWLDLDFSDWFKRLFQQTLEEIQAFSLENWGLANIFSTAPSELSGRPNEKTSAWFTFVFRDALSVLFALLQLSLELGVRHLRHDGVEFFFIVSRCAVPPRRAQQTRGVRGTSVATNAAPLAVNRFTAGKAWRPRADDMKWIFSVAKFWQIKHRATTWIWVEHHLFTKWFGLARHDWTCASQKTPSKQLSVRHSSKRIALLPYLRGKSPIFSAKFGSLDTHARKFFIASEKTNIYWHWWQSTLSKA